MKFNTVTPGEVLSIIKGHVPAGGFDFVPDLEKSHGCYIYDSLNNKEILDLFSFFATKALGHNHPKIKGDEEFKQELLAAAISNPSNSDFYTVQFANFIKTFIKVAMPEAFKHVFFISGGALAVENALKVAMDWKIKKNYAKGLKEEKGRQVIHFKEAFHGRSGYTLSLTNTKPEHIKNFTRFDWPRIENPKIHFPLDEKSLNDVMQREEKAIAQVKEAIAKNQDDICALIIEPIQSEGGDNHFRNEFLKALRVICDENDIMLIFDEVQTGVGMSGKFWAYEHFDVVPDLLAFGKKMQVCGIISTGRVDEVEDNCFKEKGRINSTWGGNLADMVHATKILRIIDEDKLVENAAVQGKYLLEKLAGLSKDKGITNIRGRGLQCAFDLESVKHRDALVKAALKNNLLLLAAGEKSIRFRPSLVIQKKEIDEAIDILDKTLAELK